MSENGEHSPDDTETETKTMEDLPNDSCKSEVKLMNRTDAPLLEDEEMPTYISVSSTSKRDNSDIANMKQQDNVSQEIEEERSPSPYPSDDQAASSVYVVSSEEDPYEDEYGDSDDMENLELQFDSEHSSNMKHLMDEEEDDEDDEDEEDDEEISRQIHNDDDDIDGNYGLDDYDGRSDDIILNRRIKNHDKEKSLSLQDLSTYENNTEFFKRKYSHGLRPSYSNIPQNIMMYSMLQGKQPTEKYHHVQSKVKLYIEEMKEQNKRFIEKPMTHQEDIIYTTINNADHKNNDTEKTKPTKTIKDYAERTIKELEIAEACDRNKETYSTSPITINGQDSKNCLEAIHEESVQEEVQINLPFESAQNEKDPINTEDKMQKQNGTVDIKQLKFNFPDRETQHFEDTIQPPLIQNGHQEISTVLLNLRTLSYEEYMHGTSDSSQKTDLNKNAHIEQEHVQSEVYNNTELMDVSINNEETTCPLRIENIKSIKTIADEAKNNNEQINFDKVNKEFTKTTSDTLEVTTLKNKLHQKTVKYNSLLDAYQKQLMENLKMKQELDELRKSLVKYETENKPPEQKMASVQTDIIIDSVSNKHNDQVEPMHVKQSDNKISNSSVASTLSSIDQWSDNNLSISMKPPEVVKALHSDDSMILVDDTPAKTTRSLSRAFITSSRILQTLSNITQTKTKPESPMVQNSKRRLSENVAIELQNDGSYQTRPSSSKKRKITDIPEPSKFLQSFKTSQVAAESYPKLDETSNVESQPQLSCDSVNKKVELSEEISSNISQLGTTASTTENKADIIDPEDNVKCFVYHEDENSKERSFIILAEETEKGKAAGLEKGRVRECGPYLLGDVEVRMSEINGTINIWGKEISQESTMETENETDVSTQIKGDKKHHCLQKTPHTRFNGSNLVCSTTKKSKISPKFELSSLASNYSHSHTPSFNMAKASCSTDNAQADNLYSPSTCVPSCEDCDLSKHRKECLRRKCIHSQEKSHSCCIHNVDAEQKCNCSLYKEKYKFEDIFNCNKEKLTTKEHRQSCSMNLEHNKHLHGNTVNSASEESTCKYHTVCHHSLHNSKENCQENQKCCNTSREACTCEPITSTDRDNSELCNHPNVNEEEPLISLRQCGETPETRRRRLTGKRVRGILMDLLRGCGDCYNPNVSSSSKVCTHKKEPYLRTSCSPRIKISPCSSPEPSCSNTKQSVGRCCQAYAKRIESQLEEFRVEMERVRSRSDAILNMLNMLHSVETI